MSHTMPCKVYIITYDENLEKTHRIFHQLIKIGFTDIKIIVGINKKELRKVSTNTWENIIWYSYGWESYTVTLDSDRFVPSNCACMLSHKIAFEDAKKNWYKKVMMVEDDLMLGYKVERYLDVVLDDAPKDRDMLRLERNLASWREVPEMINKHRFKNKTIWSSAWMMFNERAIDHILEVMNTKPIWSFDQLTNKQCEWLNSYASIWSMWIQYPLN